MIGFALLSSTVALLALLVVAFADPLPAPVARGESLRACQVGWACGTCGEGGVAASWVVADEQLHAHYRAVHRHRTPKPVRL